MGKEYVKTVYCHSVYLTYMQSISCKMLGLDELQTRVKLGGRNINNFRYVNDTTLMAKSKEELKRLLMGEKEESERTSLRLNINKKLT